MPNLPPQGLAKHPHGARWLGPARIGALLLAASALAVLLAWKVWGFADGANLQKLSVDAALVAIGAVGLTVVMRGGGIDLSVGAVLAVAAACSVRAADGGAAFSLAAALAVGAGLGALSGAATVLTRLHSALVTLATLIACTGLFLALLGGRESVAAPEGIQALAQASALGLQSIVWIAAAVVAAGALLLHGRGADQAPGGAGGRARLRSVAAFALCGAAAGLAGALYAGEYARIGPTTGRGFGLEALAAAALGGAALRAGTGSAIGAAAGAVLVGVLHNGMAMLDVGEAAQAAVFGAVLVAAVLGNRALKR